MRTRPNRARGPSCDGSLARLYFRTGELLRFRARGHLSTTPFTFAARKPPFDDLRAPATRPCTLRCPIEPHAAGDSRDVRVSFNAHPRMPHSDRIRAHLSTPTYAFAARCTPFGAHRCTCVRRTHEWMLTSARNRWRQVGLRLSIEGSGPARQLALPTGARSHLSMLAPADTRAPFSAPIFRSTFPPALMSSASVLILRPAVHRGTSVREPLCVSRRSRSIGTSVLTLALVFARVASSHLIRTQSCDLVTAATAPQFFHARPHTCSFRPCGPNEHTHCARSYSAYCHRESLARSSRSEPPCSSFRAFRPDLRVYGIASVFA